MAVVNLNPDSFSDPRDAVDVEERRRVCRVAVDEGATVVDLGAQSAALGAAEVSGEDQVSLLTPLVTRLASDGVAVSVDTYDPVAARAVLAAGAAILNDFSGTPAEDTIAAVVDADAYYVLTHNPVGPRRRQTDPDYYDDVVDHVSSFFERTLGDLGAAGLPAERVLLDPGVDVGKTPRQTLDLLRGRQRLLDRFDGPMLWAISRKDVLGALTGRPPGQRDPATLALVEALADHPRTLLRLHDVAGVADFLRVRAALRGRVDLDAASLLADDLRRQQG